MGDEPLESDHDSSFPPPLYTPAPRNGPPPLPAGAPLLPVIPLEYVAAHSLSRRPGTLIVLGIFGLIVGAISVVLSGIVTVVWWNAAIGSLPPKPPAPPGPISTNLNQSYTGQEILAPLGVPAADRPAMIQVFNLQGPTRADLSAMLDRLLAECGRSMFPAGTTPTATLYIRPDIYHNGPINPLTEDTYYNLPTGQVTLRTTTATFDDHKSPITVFEKTTTAANGFPRPTAFAIDQTMRDLRAANSNLTAEQLGFIAASLPAAMSEYDNPRYGYGASVPVEIGSLTTDGVLSVGIGKNDYYVLRDGRYALRNDCPLGLNGQTGVPYWVPPPYTPAWPGSPALMFALSGHCVLNVLIALLLMFASYRMIVAQPGSAVLMYRWAGLKLALPVIESLLSVGYILSIPYYPDAAIKYDVPRGLAGVASSAVLQIILPLVAISVLRSSDVERWLNASGIRLSMLDRQRRAIVRQQLSSGSLGWITQIVGVGLAGIAILHAVMAAMNGASQRAAPGAVHAGAMIVATALSILFFRMKPRTTAAAVVMVLVALFCSSAAKAQTTQTTRPAAVADPAQIQQVQDLLDRALAAKSHGKDADAVADQVVAIGEAAQPAAVDWCQAHPTGSALSASLAAKWRDSGLSQTQTLRPKLLAAAQNVLVGDNMTTSSLSPLHMLTALGDDEDAKAIWLKLAMGYSNFKAVAIARMKKLDPEGKLIVPAYQELAGKPRSDKPDSTNRQAADEMLMSLGSAGVDAVYKNASSDDLAVRIGAVEALTSAAERTHAAYDERLANRMIELLTDPGQAHSDEDKSLLAKIHDQSVRYLFMPDREPAVSKLVSMLASSSISDPELRADLMTRLCAKRPELQPLADAISLGRASPKAIEEAWAIVTSDGPDGIKRSLALAKSSNKTDATLGRELVRFAKSDAASIDTLLDAFPNANRPLKQTIIDRLADPEILKSSEPAQSFVIKMLDSNDPLIVTDAERALGVSAAGRALLEPRKTYSYRLQHAKPVDLAARPSNEPQDFFTIAIRSQILSSPRGTEPAIRDACQQLLTAHHVDRMGSDVMLIDMFDTGTADEQWVAANVLSDSAYRTNTRAIGPASRAKVEAILGHPMDWTDAAGNDRRVVRQPGRVATAAPSATPPTPPVSQFWPNLVWGLTGVICIMATALLTIGWLNSANSDEPA